MRRIFITSLLLLLTFAGAGWALTTLHSSSRSGPAPNSAATATGTTAAGATATGATAAGDRVPVVVATVRRADVPIFLTGIGTVQAFNSVLVKTRVDGQIVKIDFVEGQNVQAGDVLAEVDPDPYQAALDLAVATKLKDAAQLQNAQLDAQRADQLAATGAGTTQRQDTSKALVAEMIASVKADQAAIDAAQIQLNYTKIRVPFSGRTGTRQLDVGNIVRATDMTGIVTVNQVQPISVAFDLPSTTLPLIRGAMKTGDISVVAEDADGKTLATGQLAVIDNQVNAATSTIRYKATFANTDEALWPGQFVDVHVQMSVKRDAITMPITAMQQGSNGVYAFVVGANDIIEKRPLQIDFTNQDIAVVTTGVQPGEVVVTEGQYRVQAGTPIYRLPQADTTQAPPPTSLGIGQ